MHVADLLRLGVDGLDDAEDEPAIGSVMSRGPQGILVALAEKIG